MKPFYLHSPFLWKHKIKKTSGALSFGLGYPLLFHGVSLGILLTLGILAVSRHSVPLTVFSFSFLAVAAVSWTWSRLSLRKVSLQVGLSRKRAFPDESVTLCFELSNEKRLPLPWVRIEAALPCRLATGGPGPASEYTRKRLRWTTAISGRQRLKWHHPLICRARGEYSLGPLRLRSGDMFGLFPREMTLPGSESLLVYPRIVPSPGLHPALTEFLGALEKYSRFFEDPSRSIGPRDYRHQDPFKRIHWKATAKHGRLQVRQFESSTGLNLLVMLDVHSFCGTEPQDAEMFEHAVSIAASLTHELHGQRWPVGLIANALPQIRIPVSSHRDQLCFILEALARVRQTSPGPLPELFERECFRLCPETVFVIITRGPCPFPGAMIGDIKRRGYSLFLVTFENGPRGADPSGIPTFRVSFPGPFPGPGGSIG